MSHFEKIANFLPDLRCLKFQDGALILTSFKHCKSGKNWQFSQNVTCDRAPKCDM